MNTDIITTLRQERQTEWFVEFLNELRSGMKLSLPILNEEIKVIIHQLMESDPYLNLHLIRQEQSKFLVKRLVLEFLEITKVKLSSTPIQVAFDFYGKGVFVWLEIAEEYDPIGRALEDILNSLRVSYVEKGLDVGFFIAERKDNFVFPPEYAS